MKNTIAFGVLLLGSALALNPASADQEQNGSLQRTRTQGGVNSGCRAVDIGRGGPRKRVQATAYLDSLGARIDVGQWNTGVSGCTLNEHSHAVQLSTTCWSGLIYDKAPPRHGNAAPGTPARLNHDCRAQHQGGRGALWWLMTIGGS